ncbi:hypothetical protein VNO78_18051 [Psophocarpus tetragonolobus]|uniref:Uncharacterized protein n=1 Tax=Psophocarpus tetragonolobus TaxID=3891 RepID=A0AAN9SJW7_PSOTE
MSLHRDVLCNSELINTRVYSVYLPLSTAATSRRPIDVSIVATLWFFEFWPVIVLDNMASHNYRMGDNTHLTTLEVRFRYTRHQLVFPFIGREVHIIMVRWSCLFEQLI